MKKVLKLILLVAMIAALAVSAFAASEQQRELDEAAPVSETVTATVVNEAGEEEAVTATVTTEATQTTFTEEYTVEMTEADSAQQAENEAVAASLAEQVAEEGEEAAQPIILTSFDIGVTRTNEDGTTEEVHEGGTVTVTITGLEAFVGYDLYIIEDGKVLGPWTITGDSVTVALTSFSTFTPVIVKPADTGAEAGDDAGAGAGAAGGDATVSPQTMQSVLPYALAVMAVLALAGAVYARKRFN